MFQNILTHIESISVYPIVSLAIFLSFFVGVLFWAFGMKKEYIREMEQMPLLHDDEIINKGNSNE